MVFRVFIRGMKILLLRGSCGALLVAFVGRRSALFGADITEGLGFLDNSAGVIPVANAA